MVGVFLDSGMLSDLRRLVLCGVLGFVGFGVFDGAFVGLDSGAVDGA